MQIEFRKIPNTKKDFCVSFASVTLEGFFCRMSSTIVKVDAKLVGHTDLECIRCAHEETINVDEDLKLTLSDGIYTGYEGDDLIIEIENNTIDFDELIQSELESINSDYHICKQCLKDDKNLEQEI